MAGEARHALSVDQARHERDSGLGFQAMPSLSKEAPRRYARTLSNQSALARIEILDDAMVALLKQKTGIERLAMASELFRSAQQLLRAAVRRAQPEWSEEEVEQEVARRVAVDSD